MKVLVVDDNNEILDFLCLMLEKEGLNVVCANNGQEALNCLALDASICHLITDLEMPIINGHVLLKEIPSERFIKMNILIMSGSNEQLEIAKTSLSEIGNVQFIQKPFSIELLKPFLQKKIIRDQ